MNLGKVSETILKRSILKQIRTKRSEVIKGAEASLDCAVISNDHTGCSELCTLFLDPDFRKNQNGKFLSKIRFLFMAAFQDCFKNTLIAEMRGYSDENGRSPFWDALGHHFFDMDFATADYLSGIGQKVFIAELMPRFPVYMRIKEEI